MWIAILKNSCDARKYAWQVTSHVQLYMQQLSATMSCLFIPAFHVFFLISCAFLKENLNHKYMDAEMSCTDGIIIISYIISYNNY